jgi:hypothetical protein
MIQMARKDYNKPVPTNWGSVVDTILISSHPDEDAKQAEEDAMRIARLGRKSWRKLYGKEN